MKQTVPEASMTGAEQPARDGVGEYVRELLQSPMVSTQISGHKFFGGAMPEYGQTHLPWSRPVADLLAQRKICLYSHQALATDHVRSGHSAIVATPTASGKSLIYNLPVLDRHLRDPDARALYLFPLKALAQDQLGVFEDLCSGWPIDARPTAALYDGDTSDYRRRKIRETPPTALISNPEMLHLAILPHHETWATFLANLAYVVVDEAHTYRGIFGSNMAQVFQRLSRVAARYGASPTWLFCTATLGNPAQLASALLGGATPAPVLIDKSGAPQGARHFLVVNPEQSAATCAIDLLKGALAHKLRVIVYCHTRRMTELISIWATSDSGEYQGRISAYRAGFLPEERREIEAKMASGELDAVISTSALELGIDIGGLDVCILVGYPGTVMQTLQRGGRVGRTQRESAVILVAGENALDQYFARNPEELFARRPENAVINPDNSVIRMRHLECAAAELPLALQEPWLRSPGLLDEILELERAGSLVRSPDQQRWFAARKRPQRDVDLRGGGNTYTIEDEQGEPIGTMEGFRVWKETHPGAVYLHRGKAWIIDRLDCGSRRILARQESVSWFTRARCRKETEILQEISRKDLGNCAVFHGRLRITETITGYEKRVSSGNKLLSITPLDAPPQVMETEGIWFVIPDVIRQNLESQFVHFMGSIHALEHAAIGLLPLQVMADRDDFGGISIPLHPQLGLPAVFIYDGHAGGAGLAPEAFAHARELLQATLRSISACPCEDGCPSCIQSPKCGAGNRPLSKDGAIRLLEKMLEPGTLGAEICEKLEIAPAQSPLCPPPVLTPAQPWQPEPAVGEPKSAPLPPAGHYVVFDVETRKSAQEIGGWKNAALMGVSVAVLYDSADDSFHTYEQQELKAMFKRMENCDLVIGFNSWRFDYAVLQPLYLELMGEERAFALLRQLPSLDLLQRIHTKLGYRVGLDNLARATLGCTKSSDGLQALKWWQEGRLQDIADYCRKDVEITRDLYLYGLAHRSVLYTNKAGKTTLAQVDFSMPRA